MRDRQAAVRRAASAPRAPRAAGASASTAAFLASSVAARAHRVWFAHDGPFTRQSDGFQAG
jgi:hypothetical protein